MATPTPTMNAFVFRQIIHHLDVQDWEGLEANLQPSIEINRRTMSATDFFAQQRNPAGPGCRLERKLDSIALDTNGDVVVARLIHCVTPSDSPETTFEYADIVFTWFVQNRLTRWESLRDEDGVRAQHKEVPKTPHASYTGRSPPPDVSLDLKAHYGAYIDSINAKTMERDFGLFCQPELEHNGRRLTIAEYIPLISDSQDAIEGLHFHVQELLADEQTQQIAARLEFSGTPIRAWGGATPNGKPIKFHEHVMYQLHEGKITRVWSVLELDVYRRQMS